MMVSVIPNSSSIGPETYQIGEKGYVLSEYTAEVWPTNLPAHDTTFTVAKTNLNFDASWVRFNQTLNELIILKTDLQLIKYDLENRDYSYVNSIQLPNNTHCSDSIQNMVTHCSVRGELTNNGAILLFCEISMPQHRLESQPQNYCSIGHYDGNWTLTNQESSREITSFKTTSGIFFENSAGHIAQYELCDGEGIVNCLKPMFSVFSHPSPEGKIWIGTTPINDGHPKTQSTIKSIIELNSTGEWNLTFEETFDTRTVDVSSPEFSIPLQNNETCKIKNKLLNGNEDFYWGENVDQMNVRPSIYAYSINSNCVHVGIASLPPFGEYYGSKITDTDPFTGCIVQIDNYANNDSKSTLLIYCKKSDLHFLNWDQSEEDSIGLFDTLGIVFCGVVILLCLFLLPSTSNDSTSSDLDSSMMRCYYCKVEHKVENKDRHLKKCIEKEKLEEKKKKENDPNLMTRNRKSKLEEIAERVFPNARYFKYKGERMELTTDIGGFYYSSCNSRSIESIDKEMIADATRGYERRNNPQPKKKSYSGRCSQDAGGLIFSSECGTPTNNRCPRCNRYACGSCLGSRTYNGRKVCDGCNRSMSGD
tara:strand:- start:150 stop:1922 length:1773 start_codon:yes stop_codon:yes gene_type:complete